MHLKPFFFLLGVKLSWVHSIKDVNENDLSFNLILYSSIFLTAEIIIGSDIKSQLVYAPLTQWNSNAQTHLERPKTSN